MDVTTYRAIWNGTVIAESDDTIVVNGFRYFPAADVRREHLADSDHHSVCGWKGEASYYDVVVGGRRNPEAAWYYPHPKPAAGALRGRIGFWQGVRIKAVSADVVDAEEARSAPDGRRSLFARWRRVRA